MMKNKKWTFFLVVLAGMFVSQACFADSMDPELPYTSNPIVEMAVFFIINMVIEIFFAWLIFFRGNKKALAVVFLANLISQPIASMLYIHAVNGSGSYMYPIPILLVIEVAVIFFEMILYRFAIAELSWKKAFKISLGLNLISFLLGDMIFILLMIIGSSLKYGRLMLIF